jgi:hypothetical protein
MNPQTVETRLERAERRFRIRARLVCIRGIGLVISILLVVLSGCLPIVNQEEFVRAAATHSLGEAKWAFGGTPQCFKMGTESVCFHIQPEGTLGIERLLALKAEIAERMDGIVAGYEWALQHSDSPGAAYTVKPMSWNEGFIHGMQIQRMEAGTSHAVR